MIMVNEIPNTMTSEERAASKWWYGGPAHLPHPLYVKLGEKVNRKRPSKNGIYSNASGTLEYKSFQQLLNLQWEQLRDGLPVKEKNQEKKRLLQQSRSSRLLIVAIRNTMRSALMLNIAYAIKDRELEDGEKELPERLRIIKV